MFWSVKRKVKQAQKAAKKVKEAEKAKAKRRLDSTDWLKVLARIEEHKSYYAGGGLFVDLPEGCFGIHLSGYYRGITGDAWTRRYRTRRLTQGRVTFFTEPRGSNHYPMQNLLDLRLEKTFTIAQKYRIGVMFDVFNVFNDDTITSWGTRIGYDWLLPTDPDYYSSTDGHELYGIVRPRRARFGLRFMF